jgi:hypothetical protein
MLILQSSFVKKDPFPEHLESFIQKHGIRRKLLPDLHAFRVPHSLVLRVDGSQDTVSTPNNTLLDILIWALDYVIDMQGTKKVEIPEVMMRSIMKIILNEENYPILIHCNHGKVICASMHLD